MRNVLFYNDLQETAFFTDSSGYGAQCAQQFPEESLLQRRRGRRTVGQFSHSFSVRAGANGGARTFRSAATGAKRGESAGIANASVADLLPAHAKRVAADRNVR